MYFWDIRKRHIATILMLLLLLGIITFLFLFNGFKLLLTLNLLVVGLIICIISKSIIFIFYLFLLGMFAFSRDFSYLSLNIGGVLFYVTEAILALFILKNIILAPIKRTIKEVKTPLDIPFIIYYTICLILFIKTAPNYGVVAFRHFALVYYSLFFYVITENFRSFEDLKNLVKVFFVGGIVSAILLLGITLPFPDISHFIRSLLPRSHSIGRSTCISLSVIFLIALRDHITNKKLRKVMFFATYIQILAILFGMSRSAWVALFGALIFLLIISKGKRNSILSLYFPIFVGIFLLVFVFSYLLKSPFLEDMYIEARTVYDYNDIDNAASANSKWRIETDKIGIKEAIQNPLGKGFGPPAPESVWKDWSGSGDINADYHNSYIAILTRTGFLGFMTFIYITIIFYYHGIQFIMNTNDPQYKAYMIGILSSHLSVFINSQFSVVLQGPYMGIFYWILMGMGMVLINLNKESSNSGLRAIIS